MFILLLKPQENTEISSDSKMIVNFYDNTVNFMKYNLVSLPYNFDVKVWMFVSLLIAVFVGILLFAKGGH
jgi:hypothetical protein